jgi:hypothetical protein
MMPSETAREITESQLLSIVNDVIVGTDAEAFHGIRQGVPKPLCQVDEPVEGYDPDGEDWWRCHAHGTTHATNPAELAEEMWDELPDVLKLLTVLRHRDLRLSRRWQKR